MGLKRQLETASSVGRLSRRLVLLTMSAAVAVPLGKTVNRTLTRSSLSDSIIFLLSSGCAWDNATNTISGKGAIAAVSAGGALTIWGDASACGTDAIGVGGVVTVGLMLWGSRCPQLRQTGQGHTEAATGSDPKMGEFA